MIKGQKEELIKGQKEELIKGQKEELIKGQKEELTRLIQEAQSDVHLSASLVHSRLGEDCGLVVIHFFSIIFMIYFNFVGMFCVLLI